MSRIIEHKIAVIIGIIIVVLSIGLITAVSYIHQIDNNMAGEINESKAAEEVLSKVTEKKTNIGMEKANSEFSDVFYTLVLGVDKGDENDISRSDVMMVVRTDTQKGIVSMMSIPRDLQVDIEGYGINKINAAYAFGETSLAIDTVKELTELPIHHYVVVNFRELEEVIDELGGIDVNVPVSNDETGATSSSYDFDKGITHMNGEKTLSFVRERYGYNRGDFQRADNQRLVAMAIVKKVLSKSIFEMPSAIATVSKSLTTDLTVADLIELSSLVKANETLTFYSSNVPCDSQLIDEVWYDIVDEEALADMVAALENGEDISELESGESGDTTADGVRIDLDSGKTEKIQNSKNTVATDEESASDTEEDKIND